MQAMWRCLASTGRFWDGNEIWLLLALPAIYLAGGSALLLVALACLIVLRGIGAELRGKIASASLRRVLDTGFGVASLLLGVGVGAAIGCVIRGVPPTGGSRILFPAICGIFGLVLLTMQRAAWMALRSSGKTQEGYRDVASTVWWGVLVCFGIVIAASFAMQPDLVDRLQSDSWVFLFMVIALAGLIGARLCISVAFDLGTFASICCLIGGLAVSVAAGQMNAGAAHLRTGMGLIWCAPAFLLAAAYKIRAAADF